MPGWSWLDRTADRIEFETPLLGEAGALACAAAVAVLELGLGVEADGAVLSDAFGQVEVGAGAGRLRPTVLESGLAVIDDTYNANPASMVSSIRAAAELAKVTGRELVLVLGEMRELGTYAGRGHAEVGRAAVESGARLVAVIGGGVTSESPTERSELESRSCSRRRRMGVQRRWSQFWGRKTWF